MKFKKIACIIGIIAGVVMISMGGAVQDVATPSIGKSIKFGADFYTEMYSVTQDVGDAVQYSYRYICTAIGSLIVALGIFDICYFLAKLADAYKKEEPAVASSAAPAAPATPAPAAHTVTVAQYVQPTPQVAKTLATPQADTWVCLNCNTVNNAKYGQCKRCGQYRRQETEEE